MKKTTFWPEASMDEENIQKRLTGLSHEVKLTYGFF